MSAEDYHIIDFWDASLGGGQPQATVDSLFEQLDLTRVNESTLRLTVHDASKPPAKQLLSDVAGHYLTTLVCPEGHKRSIYKNIREDGSNFAVLHNKSVQLTGEGYSRKKQTRHRAAILALAIAAAVQSRQRLDDMSPEFQELCRRAMY